MKLRWCLEYIMCTTCDENCKLNTPSLEGNGDCFRSTLTDWLSLSPPSAWTKSCMFIGKQFYIGILVWWDILLTFSRMSCREFHIKPHSVLFGERFEAFRFSAHQVAVISGNRGSMGRQLRATLATQKCRLGFRVIFQSSSCCLNTTKYSISDLRTNFGVHGVGSFHTYLKEAKGVNKCYANWSVWKLKANTTTWDTFWDPLCKFPVTFRKQIDH